MSVTWTDEMRAIFVVCLRNELGDKHLNDEGLNKAAWNRITQAFNEHTGGNFTKTHLHSHLGTMKKKYYIYKELKENPDFTWDDESKLPIGSTEAWENFLSIYKGAKDFQFKPLFYYDEFEQMFGFTNTNSIASVISSLKKRRRSTETNQSDDDSSTNDENENNSHDTDAIEVQRSSSRNGGISKGNVNPFSKKPRISTVQLSRLSNSHHTLPKSNTLPKSALKSLFDTIADDIVNFDPLQRFKVKKYLFENRHLIELIPYLDEEERVSFFAEMSSS